MFRKSIFQVHSSNYRNPDQLPPGAVLIVGAGASGCQIADELNERGRRVYLSVGPVTAAYRDGIVGEDFAFGGDGPWEPGIVERFRCRRREINPLQFLCLPVSMVVTTLISGAWPPRE